ncbi:MAG: HEAT repeat domain-containing protein [Cyanobacteriota bacterium]|nr:HEAT repeat domain-containing protein [Cyanobacteriota bacterium]
MNPSLLGVFAATLLAATLWMVGRRPKPLLHSTDTQAVAALNRTQNALVWEARQELLEVEADAADRAGDRAGARALVASGLGLTVRQRAEWLRELRLDYRAGGERRLEAIGLARAWGHREALPLLRLGLRDPDPRVMREAALAMEAFRGKASPLAARPQAAAPPRNVARTR